MAIRKGLQTRLQLQPLLLKRMASVSFARPDGSKVPGLAFGQAGKPGIVCIQEWWGVDFAIKAHAELIASKGFRVIVPDLYRGELGVEAEEVGFFFPAPFSPHFHSSTLSMHGTRMP